MALGLFLIERMCHIRVPRMTRPGSGWPQRTGSTLTGLRSRTFLLSVVVAVLLVAIPPTTSAATIRRTWTATITGFTVGVATAAGATAGSATASGTAVLLADWAGTGRYTAQVRGLLPTSTYAVVVYVGTCSKPTVLLRLPNLTVGADGNAAAASSVTQAQMARIWSRAEVGGIALRIAAGSDVHCAALTSPVATRVAVPGLGIDLPIVLQRGNAFPWCNVAMYMNSLSQPGEAGGSFIYAHARTGMFLPLLAASLVKNGARMLGMKVYVWTSDDRLYTYQITQVRRHQHTLPDLWAMTSQQVWLQTSEGPYGTLNKLDGRCPADRGEQRDPCGRKPEGATRRVQPLLGAGPPLRAAGPPVPMAPCPSSPGRCLQARTGSKLAGSGGDERSASGPSGVQWLVVPPAVDPPCQPRFVKVGTNR